MLSFFPLDVLDEILDVIESFSEEFLIYSFNIFQCISMLHIYVTSTILDHETLI